MDHKSTVGNETNHVAPFTRIVKIPVTCSCHSKWISQNTKYDNKPEALTHKQLHFSWNLQRGYEQKLDIKPHEKPKKVTTSTLICVEPSDFCPPT